MVPWAIVVSTTRAHPASLSFLFPDRYSTSSLREGVCVEAIAFALHNDDMHSVVTFAALH
jgi:hypothetical protein